MMSRNEFNLSRIYLYRNDRKPLFPTRGVLWDICFLRIWSLARRFEVWRIFVQKNDVKRLVFLCGFPEMLSCFSFSFFMLMSGYCHFLLPFKGVKRVQSCHEWRMQYMLQVCFYFAKKRLQRFVFRLKCVAKVSFLSHRNFSCYEIHMTLDFLAVSKTR